MRAVLLSAYIFFQVNFIWSFASGDICIKLFQLKTIGMSTMKNVKQITRYCLEFWMPGNLPLPSAVLAELEVALLPCYILSEQDRNQILDLGSRIIITHTPV